MNTSELSDAGRYAYLAGMCRGESRVYMAQARNAVYPEVKKLYAGWARSEFRAAMRYMRLARAAQAAV